MVAKLYGNKFTPEQIGTLTAANADSIYKPLELDEKIKENSANMQMKNEMMRQNQSDRRDKQSADSYQKAAHDLNTYRGNNAVQTAAGALTNVQNALSLADKGNLTPDQLHLFSSEMAKLATGGVPGHSDIEALMPNTMKTQLAKFTSFFANKPSDADAQAFIENNRGYLKELAKNYGNVVGQFQANTLDGYKHKLNPDDFKDLQSRYPLMQQSQQPSGSASQQKPSWAK
jgi:hypothetical protein